MRLDRLSVAAAVVAAAAPCVWLAGCVDAQDTIESSVQQRTDAGGTPPGGGGTPENENPQPQPEGPTSSCGPSVLYNRTIDASRYKFGCPEIEVSDAAAPVGHHPAEHRPAVIIVVIDLPSLGGVSRDAGYYTTLLQCAPNGVGRGARCSRRLVCWR